MKSKRNLRTVLYVFLSGIAIVSCNDFEEEFEILTDVYVINKKVGDVVKSAPAYYAYANQAITSASVALPSNGGNVVLETFSGSVFTLAKEPVNTDFKTTPPADGSYAFSITGKNGENHIVPDILKYVGLGIPQITKTTFAQTTLNLDVEWTKVNGAKGYVVKIVDLEGKLIFSGYLVDPAISKYTVTGSSISGSWVETANEDETYVLQVNAILYDADANNVNSAYNISEVSVGEKVLVWGVN